MALDLTSEEKAAAERVSSRIVAWELTFGNTFRDRCNRLYREYRGFQKFKHAWVQAGPNDRDGMVYDARKAWGANVHVPVAFDTVETIAPRAVANRPRMIYLPRNQEAEPNLQNVRLMIDAQQERIDFELELQDTLKNGMIYGLGPSKTYWKREWITERRMKRRWTSFVAGGDDFTLGRPTRKLSFDDPMFEAVDPYDFAWDEFGSTIETCKWVGHRVWFGLVDCLDRIESGAWNTPAAQRLDEDALRSVGSGVKYDEVWAERMEASGFSTFQSRAAYRDGRRGEQIHEVWEIHTRERVFTLLDRQVVVQDAESPCPGHIGFQVYRPTRLPKQMVGIGEIEPIEHLARELDTLRSQRRDAATLALCGGYAFDSGMVDEDDLVFGPAAAIEVRGDPRAALMPLQIKEVPGSSYQEEAAIWSNIQRVSGLNDALAGGDGGSVNTATEAQLVQASLSKRVEAKSRRLEVETIRPAARCFLAMDQRMIRNTREERETLPPDPETGEQRWRWWNIGPTELMGEFEIQPEGGSMQARNVPEDMQRAGALMTAFNGNPLVDQAKLYLETLRLMGVERPQEWLRQNAPAIPPEVFDVLQRAGVRTDVIQFAIREAQNAHPMLPSPDEQPEDQAVAA